MPTNTYVALQTQTVTSSVTFVDFTGISSAYTDLVLVVSARVSGSGIYVNYTLNNDTGSNYSRTQISGNGTSAGSYRASNETAAFYSTATVPFAANTFGVYTLQFQNYSNTTTYKTVLCRNNSINDEVGAIVNLWRTPQAINRISINTTSGTYEPGSTFSLYGIAAEGVSPAPKATGGAIYSDSTYYYHVFGSTGTFTPSQALTADVLVVAGGGASGSRLAGEGNCAGGGAGGLRNITSQSLSNGVAYTCTIGSGGAAAGATNFGARGGTGTNSSFSGSGFTTINASGGGGGGAQTNTQGVNLAIQQGGTGGSAGGSAFDGNGNNPASSVAGNSGGYSPAEGNAGGSGGTGAPNYIMGGGGGAGGAGVSTYEAWSTTGTGGPGITYSNGQVYAKGGNGQSNTGPGLINTGNGGNGWGGGNAGGSGIVVVRYAK